VEEGAAIPTEDDAATANEDEGDVATANEDEGHAATANEDEGHAATTNEDGGGIDDVLSGTDLVKRNNGFICSLAVMKLDLSIASAVDLD